MKTSLFRLLAVASVALGLSCSLHAVQFPLHQGHGIQDCNNDGEDSDFAWVSEAGPVVGYSSTYNYFNYTYSLTLTIDTDYAAGYYGEVGQLTSGETVDVDLM
jgi:hypothetical protein